MNISFVYWKEEEEEEGKEEEPDVGTAKPVEEAEYPQLGSPTAALENKSHNTFQSRSHYTSFPRTTPPLLTNHVDFCVTAPIQPYVFTKSLLINQSINQFHQPSFLGQYWHEFVPGIKLGYLTLNITTLLIDIVGIYLKRQKRVFSNTFNLAIRYAHDGI